MLKTEKNPGTGTNIGTFELTKKKKTGTGTKILILWLSWYGTHVLSFEIKKKKIIYEMPNGVEMEYEGVVFIGTVELRR